MEAKVRYNQLSKLEEIPYARAVIGYLSTLAHMIVKYSKLPEPNLVKKGIADLTKESYIRHLERTGRLNTASKVSEGKEPIHPAWQKASLTIQSRNQ